MSPAILQDINQLLAIKEREYDIENRKFLRYFYSRYGIVLMGGIDDRCDEEYCANLRRKLAAEQQPSRVDLRITQSQLQHAWGLFWEFAG